MQSPYSQIICSPLIPTNPQQVTRKLKWPCKDRGPFLTGGFSSEVSDEHPS